MLPISSNEVSAARVSVSSRCGKIEVRKKNKRTRYAGLLNIVVHLVRAFLDIWMV